MPCSTCTHDPRCQDVCQHSSCATGQAEDFCGVQQTVSRRTTDHGTEYKIAKWTCPNCGKACSCIYVDGSWCHGDSLSISFGPEKDADGKWTSHHKCGACWLAASPDVGKAQAPSLTDEEIAEIAERMEATDPSASYWREFARAVLSAAIAQSAPSPVLLEAGKEGKQ